MVGSTNVQSSIEADVALCWASACIKVLPTSTLVRYIYRIAAPLVVVAGLS